MMHATRCVIAYLSQDEEDIDACVDEVNKVLGMSVARPADDCDFAVSKPMLSIEHRSICCLRHCTCAIHFDVLFVQFLYV